MTSPILQTAVRLLMPLLLLLACFLLFRGHNQPGGGFVAGLVVSASFVLHAIAFGVDASRRALLVHPSTLLGVGTQLSFGENESDLLRAIRESTQQSGSRAGDQIVSRSLNIQPSIKVRPGWPLRVVVHKDIVLRPWTAAGR